MSVSVIHRSTSSDKVDRWDVAQQNVGTDRMRMLRERKKKNKGQIFSLGDIFVIHKINKIGQFLASQKDSQEER